MIMFLILGFIDVIVGALMITTHLGLLHEWRIAIMGAAYLIGKGAVLHGSFLSILDIIAGIYFILIMLGVRTVLVYVFALVFVYKFITSLIMRG
jgi:predicted membrane protein